METSLPLAFLRQTMNNHRSNLNHKLMMMNDHQHQKLVPTTQHHSVGITAPINVMLMMSNSTKPTTAINSSTTTSSNPAKGTATSTTTRKRRVRFHKGGDDDETLQTTTNTTQTKVTIRKFPPLFETLTQDICDRLWFQNSEIAAFRAETRKLILCGKQSPDDELAGLERFNLERSTRKKTAIRLVLLAQLKSKASNSGTTPSSITGGATVESFIQSIASECSEWAVETGVLQGFQDFLQVYDPLTSLLGTNKKEGTTYNDSLFGGDDDGSGNNIGIMEGIMNDSNKNKRKSRDLDSEPKSEIGFTPGGVAG
eukprot:CAMPEP_0117048652 /NCGR_PEP_ID=MMETSP0472-20121206/33635_1 /TAXON_ID=693140 ORGANISM="Tiarina fusus, Strain LIS" /NCGR_SAMPLE_ID=MMETSP0472 /ASSEMBLY_ACC=CAM_ASM_000603 /LENGTH=311 /DNA_ID=CAMNT_0004761841 /DNA_START=116 /DNA_END=1048 /DNA_ORIENTATION=-